MALYNIYAGLSGGFGGYNYHKTEEFDSIEEAEEEARRLAIEEYESYEGCGGILSESEIRDEYCEDNNIDRDFLTFLMEEDIADMYNEQIESWITTLVTTVEEDPDHDR